MASGTSVVVAVDKRPTAWLDRWVGTAQDTRIGLYAAVPVLAILFVAPVLIAALLLDEPSPGFWAVLVLDLVALFVFAVTTISRPSLVIGVLVFWFAAQRLVVALVAPQVDADTVRLLLTYKEGFCLILPAAAAVALYVRWRRGERALTPLIAADAAAVTWLGLIAVEFVAAGDPSTPELTYARRFAVPALLYLGGRMLIPLAEQLSSSLRVVVAIAIGVALFGLVERFALGIGFWADGVDAATFYQKQVDSGLLPENWTVIYRGVPDGIFIALPLEVPVRRLVSTFLEPTTLGMFLAFSLLLLLLTPGLGKQPTIAYRRLAAGGVILLAVAVLATLSRGAMITILAGGALFVSVRLIQDRARLATLPLALGSFVALVMTLGVVITTFSQFPGDSLVRDVLATRAVSGLSAEPSAATTPPVSQPPSPGSLEEITVHPPGSTAEGASKHFGGLRSGLDRMLDEPWGAGLGAAGNWSGTPEAGGESTVGVVAAQLGVVGLLTYLAFYAAMIAGLIAAAWRGRGSLGDVQLVLAGAIFGLFLVSFVSESALGLLGNAPYFIFAGWVLAMALPPARRITFTPVPGDPSPDSSSASDELDAGRLDVQLPSGDTNGE